MAISWEERQERAAILKERSKLRSEGVLLEEQDEGCSPMHLNLLLGLVAIVVIAAALVGLAYLCWRYPLPLAIFLVPVGAFWPIVRLIFLNQTDQLLRDHENIPNPRAQRVLSCLALGCVVVIGALLLAGQLYGELRLHLLAAIPASVYGVLTCIVFESFLTDWAKKIFRS